MTRRKELKNVANGIVSSFNSRNNDVSGYWGIGKLCKASKENDTSSVTIDLMNKQISVDMDEFDALIKHYQEMLYRLVRKRAMPDSWITKAVIAVKFDQDFDGRYHYFRSALGHPYICTVTITDDLAKQHAVTTGGNCLPHDPSREFRSSRISDIQKATNVISENEG